MDRDVDQGPPSAEALLAHAGWMRSLAVQLVGDRSLADDVVQDAWVAALERPPAPRSAAGWRAWLGAVVANLARGRRRRERAREGVELRAARPEASPGDAEALERLRLQRELAEALLELSEPSRSAVILRHLEGLGAAEIARRTGCSPEAARQRVARGIAELRRRLAARRDGRDWLAALAVVARAPEAAPPAGAALVGTGALLMSKSAWCVVAIACVVAGFVAWSGARGAAARADHEPTAHAPSTARPAETLDVPAAAAAREAVADAGARTEVAPARASRPATVTVRDRTGAAIAGAALGPRGSPAPWGTTDESGLLVLAGSHFQDVESIATSAAHDDYLGAELELRAGAVTELVLDRKPSVVIEVLQPDGSPAEGPRTGCVWVRDAASGESRPVYAEVLDGVLCARRLPLGRLERVEARARGFATGRAALEARLDPESVVRARVEVAPGLGVHGRVVDSATREPIPGATVWAESAFFDEGSVTQWATTDAEGAFELQGLQAQEFQQDGDRGVLDMIWVQVSAKADGFQGKLLEGKVQQRTEQSRYFVEIELTKTSCRLRGRLLGMEGLTKPVFVQAISYRGQFAQAYAKSDGAFDLEGLEPGVFWVFASNSPWFQDDQEPPSDPRVCARVDVALEPGETETIELALERGTARIAGRVVDAQGEPVAGVEVRAQLDARQGMVSWGAFRWRAVSGADGGFAFEELLSGHYSLSFLEVPGDWCSLANHVSLELEPGGARDDARLVLARCVGVEGWVELAGRDPATLRVQARGERDAQLGEESPVAADATFRLARLPAVEAQVVLLEGNRELARVPVGAQGARGVVLRPEPR